MHSGQKIGILVVSFWAIVSFCTAFCHAQAALLMEEPYGLYGLVNPTGHNAVYLERICAQTPFKLRRCKPGELGVVVSRYDGVDGFDWVAIPLIPYLYSVESAADVPDHVDRAMVDDMRDRYREAHFLQPDPDQPARTLAGGRWTLLVGEAYERRIYAFRFNTTEQQDDALIAWLNAGPNRSHFQMFYNNCADFARAVLNFYLPHNFKRSIFPDAGVTTPKQVAYKLVRYARKHPQTNLTVFEIPQIPGYSSHSHSTKGIAESFSTTLYAVPLTMMNPYLAGGIALDYLFRGRYRLVPRNSVVLGPDDLSVLTALGTAKQNAASAVTQANGVVPGQSLGPI